MVAVRRSQGFFVRRSGYDFAVAIKPVFFNCKVIGHNSATCSIAWSLHSGFEVTSMSFHSFYPVCGCVWKLVR